MPVRLRFFYLLQTVLFPAVFCNGQGPAVSEQTDFATDIEPILERHCFRCHGPEQQEGGLRLDVRKRALEGGDSGAAIVPGRADKSALMKRVMSGDEDFRMPPEGPRLSVSGVEKLRKWINQGAAGLPETAGHSAADTHWAFQPVQLLPVPAVRNEKWCRNDVDRFVAVQLEDHNIRPSAEARPETLVRRVSLDLTGLPPDWERVRSFQSDSRPDAWARLVDELLETPQYGERWARHWLDVARYADSSGYEADTPRQIWAWRDWVIDALNSDMPFDQFVTEQLAGDLLPDATDAQRIATGFHCNAMMDPGVRHESVIDQVNTTGAVFLGLTTGCAQCHSHKTDPITQREFYQLYAFFNEATVTKMPLGARWSATSPAGAAEKTEKAEPPTTLVMSRTPQPTHIFVRGDAANPGAVVQPGVPDFLNAALPDRLTHETSGVSEQDSGTSPLTRLDLARWIIDRDNPLTARVTVNRIWQRYFGTGIVRTENDFGLQTPQPLHHQLLDYLAATLQGADEEVTWKGLKSVHRLIVNSATYRQSSVMRPEISRHNSDNRLIACQRRLRLESEFIRDAALSVSGLVSDRIGGPPVFPYQAPGILDNRATPATWTMSEGEDRYRRGLYTWVWRLTPHPNLPLFDAPDGVTACTRRDRSNVPVQALTMLNDPSFVEAAQALAGLIMRNERQDDRHRVVVLFRRCLSRSPSDSELQRVLTLVREQRQQYEANPQQADLLVADVNVEKFNAPEFAAWTVVCRVMMNLDEFITRE